VKTFSSSPLNGKSACAPAVALSPARPVADSDRTSELPARLPDPCAQADKRECLELLAGRLAHDFNNYLVGMLTAADLLCRDLPPGSEQHALAELIGKSADRAANLTRQLLVYAGRGPLLRQPLDLNVLVTDSLASLTATFPSNVTMVAAPAAGLPLAEGDPGQIRQMITHLVANAAEAIGPRAGHILIATGVEEIGAPACDSSWASCFVLRPLAPEGGRFVYVSVVDNGAGMTEAVLHRAFDPFFSTRSKGRGLGLSLVQGIVRAHGGGLLAASTPGGGTSLRVWLPADPPRHPPCDGGVVSNREVSVNKG